MAYLGFTVLENDGYHLKIRYWLSGWIPELWAPYRLLRPIHGKTGLETEVTEICSAQGLD